MMRWERVHGRARARETPEGRQSAGRKGGIWGPGRRWGHTCNVIKGGRLLYVFGGYGEDNCQTNDVHVFDTVKQSWSKPMMKGIPPSPRDSHTCTTVENNLFVFGGTDGANPLNDLHILDTSTNTWSMPIIQGNGPGAREGHTTTLVGKRLFVFGGCGKSRDNPEEIYYSDLYILDMENFVWDRAVTTGSLPSARDSHTCSTWNNKLIILGGEDASDYYLADVFILNIDTFIWTELNTSGHMLAPRAGHSTVALGKNLFVFGGFTDARNLYDDLHILDLETGIWTRVVNINPGPTARFSAAGDCLDPDKGILIFIGGCNASLEALDDMFYLHTGMPVENGKAQQRREKLSLRKELKRKCQEICVASTTPKNNVEINTPKNNMEMHSHGTTIPFSQRAVAEQENSCDLETNLGENGFEATITSEFPRGYCIETKINGKLLRGLIFFKNPIISSEFLASTARRSQHSTNNIIKPDDTHYQAGTTTNLNQLMDAETNSKEIVPSNEQLIETNISGLDKLTSSSKNKDSESLNQ